jgi:hypothetical protein
MVVHTFQRRRGKGVFISYGFLGCSTFALHPTMHPFFVFLQYFRHGGTTSAPLFFSVLHLGFVLRSVTCCYFLYSYLGVFAKNYQHRPRQPVEFIYLRTVTATFTVPLGLTWKGLPYIHQRWEIGDVSRYYACVAADDLCCLEYFHVLRQDNFRSSYVALPAPGDSTGTHFSGIVFVITCYCMNPTHFSGILWKKRI